MTQIIGLDLKGSRLDHKWHIDLMEHNLIMKLEQNNVNAYKKLFFKTISKNTLYVLYRVLQKKCHNFDLSLFKNR